MSLAVVASGDILAMDLGSQFTKVALVSTGRFDIVPNLQSKRKTPTAISVKGKLREFGDDALLAQAKNPGKVASFFRWLVGANLTETDANSLHPSAIVTPFTVSMDTVRKSALFGSEEFGHRQIEEVLAQMIWYSKNLVEEHDTPATGKHKIGSLKDLVFTVPSWATRAERQAIIDAAHIAGMPRVSLVHETSAAAVQRAFDLELSANTSDINVMYLNVGAGHFEACIVQYGMIGSGTLATPTAKVLGCQHSLEAAGMEISAQLAREGAAAFLKKNPKINKDAFLNDSIAQVRLFRQAEIAKQTLSANKETVFSVESIFDEKDLKTQISRSHVERVAKPMVVQIEAVVARTLERCNVSKSDVHQVEVIGGGWRVPAVQARLEEAVAPLALGQHLNGDEAMVFGAAFLAANASSSFRVRKVLFTEASENEYSIRMTPATVPAGEEAKWPRTQTIFPVGHKLNSVKAVKVNLDSDLVVDVFENANLIESISVSGRNQSAVDPQIVFKVKLDSNGIFSVPNGDAIYERTEEQTIRIPLNSTNEKNETEYNVTTLLVPKKSKISLALNSVFQASPLAMTQDQIRTARSALKTVIDAEAAVKLVTKTKNDLEALVYATYDQMDSAPDVLAHSSPEEREAAVAAAKLVEEWLDDNGYGATVDELKEQLAGLRNAGKPIYDRIEEERKRKEAEATAKKIQEELERIAALNATQAVDNTTAETETITPVPELGEEIHASDESTSPEPEVSEESSQEEGFQEL